MILKTGNLVVLRTIRIYNVQDDIAYCYGLRLPNHKYPNHRDANGCLIDSTDKRKVYFTMPATAVGWSAINRSRVTSYKCLGKLKCRIIYFLTPDMERSTQTEIEVHQTPPDTANQYLIYDNYFAKVATLSHPENLYIDVPVSLIRQQLENNYGK